jgi:ribonuclease-3
MITDAYADFAATKLGVNFNDINLLVTAFTHRSYLNEHRNTVKQHNERLEFLGDAVLELVVTEYLYLTYNEPEGVLTNWRSSLVRTQSISAAASKYEFEPLLRLSRGEKRGTERARTQILANSYEAVVGAIYLDQGYEVAKRFISDSIISTFENILSTGSWLDPKSYLQELAQSQESATPVYKVINEDGPDHDKTFLVGVYVTDKLRGQGTGRANRQLNKRQPNQRLSIIKIGQSKIT